MDRVLSDEVAKHVGKSVLVHGWLHKKRLIGGINKSASARLPISQRTKRPLKPNSANR